MSIVKRMGGGRKLGETFTHNFLLNLLLSTPPCDQDKQNIENGDLFFSLICARGNCSVTNVARSRKREKFQDLFIIIFFLLFFIVKIYFVWKEQKNEATKKKSDFAVQVVV
jgi:hypothetical protein